MGSKGVLVEQPIHPGRGGWYSRRIAPCPTSAAQPIPAAQPSSAMPVPGTRDEVLQGWGRGVSGDSSMPWCGSSGVQWHPRCPKAGLPPGRAALPSLLCTPWAAAWTCLSGSRCAGGRRASCVLLLGVLRPAASEGCCQHTPTPTWQGTGGTAPGAPPDPQALPVCGEALRTDAGRAAPPSRCFCGP